MRTGRDGAASGGAGRNGREGKAEDASGGGAGIQNGDTVTVAFDQATNAYGIATANIDTVLALSGGHVWSTISSAVWSTDLRKVTITFGTGSPTVTVGDAITIGTDTIMDWDEGQTADGSPPNITGSNAAQVPKLVSAVASDESQGGLGIQNGGLEALPEKTRRKPNLKNRVAPETEQAVVETAIEQPAYGQVRASDEMRKEGILVSPGAVRNIWQRDELETFSKRLATLGEKSAKEGIVYTEAQLAALEKAKRQKETDPDQIDTHRPGYLLAQDTMYVGYLKGLGRIYQQTVIDAYSSVAFAKLYDTKVPVTAADCLNDRVMPFFEERGVKVLRVLSDRGTEYCGRDDRHAYQLYLALTEIEHTRTKTKHRQSNGICERFHQTCLNELYKVAFRRKIYRALDELQVDLDDYVRAHNQSRTHQGKRCQGRTPTLTFVDALPLAYEKHIDQLPQPPRMESHITPSEAASAAAVHTAETAL